MGDTNVVVRPSPQTPDPSLPSALPSKSQTPPPDPGRSDDKAPRGPEIPMKGKPESAPNAATSFPPSATIAPPGTNPNADPLANFPGAKAQFKSRTPEKTTGRVAANAALSTDKKSGNQASITSEGDVATNTTEGETFANNDDQQSAGFDFADPPTVAAGATLTPNQLLANADKLREKTSKIAPTQHPNSGVAAGSDEVSVRGGTKTYRHNGINASDREGGALNDTAFAGNEAGVASVESSDKGTKLSEIKPPDPPKPVATPQPKVIQLPETKSTASWHPFFGVNTFAFDPKTYGLTDSAYGDLQGKMNDDDKTWTITSPSNPNRTFKLPRYWHKIQVGIHTIDLHNSDGSFNLAK